MPVPAFTSAPMPSKIWSISDELKRSVPLNSRCSRKCEMPACSTRLVARAGADPEAERDRAHRGHRLGDHPDARVELGQLWPASVNWRLVRTRRAVAAAIAAAATAAAASAAAAAATAAAAAAVAATAAAAPPPPPPVAGADGGQLLGGLAGDVGVLGEAQADAAALAVDLDHLAPRSRRRG